MKTQGFSQICLSLLIAILLISFGCSEVRLKKRLKPMAYKVTQAGLELCTTKADTIHSNLKFIFVIDRSGSNQQRYDRSRNSLSGTDLDGVRRFDAIIQFIQQYQQSQYIHWAMVNFSSQVLGGSNYQPFTNNKATFENFVKNQKNKTQQIDSGWTNYRSAIDRVSHIISGDIAHSKTQTPRISSYYVVFFVSDGEPIVNGRQQSSDPILNRIRNIISLEKSEKKLVEGIQMNTAYYFENPASPGARKLLNNMSLAGNGDFLEFGSGQQIDLRSYVIPERTAKSDIKEIWATNVNTVWHNNILQADADRDGLPDELETTLGSDPQIYDSDSNGVGDGVEYAISGGKKPCKNDDCNQNGADPYITCRSLQLPHSSAQKYNDQDKDFLNDCEEKLLDTDPEEHDTNYDYIPDDLAFKNGVKMNEASNAGYLDPDYDGLNDYQELKYNTPARVHNQKVSGLKKLKYIGGLIHSDPNQDCYHFDVSNMATRTNYDTIRVYIMENTKTLDEKRIMRTAEKQMIGGAVFFTNADFK